MREVGVHLKSYSLLPRSFFYWKFPYLSAILRRRKTHTMHSNLDIRDDLSDALAALHLGQRPNFRLVEWVQRRRCRACPNCESSPGHPRRTRWFFGSLWGTRVLFCVNTPTENSYCMPCILTFSDVSSSCYSELSRNWCSQLRICQGIHLASKLQATETWSAATLPPHRLCYRPLAFLRDFSLIALSFPQG
jgi:hypothetical protein